VNDRRRMVLVEVRLDAGPDRGKQVVRANAIGQARPMQRELEQKRCMPQPDDRDLDDRGAVF